VDLNLILLLTWLSDVTRQFYSDSAYMSIQITYTSALNLTSMLRYHTVTISIRKQLTDRSFWYICLSYHC